MPQRTLFDDLTKFAATPGVSRRSVLVSLLVGASSIALGKPGSAGAATIAPVAATTPTCPSGTIVCQPTNDVTLSVADINAYIDNCGVICPNGERLCGAGGCTSTDYSWSNADIRNFQVKQVSKHLWCATASLYVHFDASPTSTVVNLTIPDACCADACRQNVASVEAGLAAHEALHRQTITSVIAQANRDWAGRQEKGCGSTRAEAIAQLTAVGTADFQSYRKGMDSEIAVEPPQAPKVDASVCAPATTSTSTCCSGTCADLNTDPMNCGSCGHQCPTGATCTGGVCGSTCDCRPSSDTRAGSGCCPSGYTCYTIYDGTNPVCCNADQTSCVCPSGYSANSGYCYPS